ncbi:hypothetical protein [Schinkia azotoformans]|uniref:hypothetical protein n=1 Tax=Schinkia azotoformans TaxID=1454 RepID=UPI002DBE1ECB|nr:hypothetical protein [Schinkia azotoformans]MEC1786089.1 hypothetical protein [Schinkia azotoformans]MED4420125.1 hypothetical protein [Schinkia azotoformans]
MIHSYSSRYGWSKDYILENVSLDEHFIYQELFEKEQRNKYLMESYIHMLPHIEDKARKDFISNLTDEEKQFIGKNTKTDFEALKRAKEMQKNNFM